MKRSIVLVLTLASGFALSAAAQTLPAPPTSAAAPAGPAKVAVIAFQAVSQTNEFQRDFADLQKKYEPKRTQLKTMADEIDGLEKQLQAQGSKLSDADRATRPRPSTTRRSRPSASPRMRRTTWAGGDERALQQGRYQGLRRFVRYCKQQGFTLVLDGTSNQQQAPVVLYATPNIDISKAIVDAYNLKSGVPAPPPQPPAAPSPKPAPKPPVTH
jgi:outer membrane protein